MKIFRDINTTKATALTLTLNILEIAALAALTVFAAVTPDIRAVPYLREAALFIFPLLMVDNLINLRSYRHFRWIREQNDMLRDAIAQVDRLNTELRMQRHDFMNQLQVVYTLAEMGEGERAVEYIDKLNASMQRGTLSNRTEQPAVNALLQAKAVDCVSRGIAADIVISSAWKRLPVEEWEMCRVLGNIIDNAMDALAGQSRRQLTVELYEEVDRYGFRISNNGPMIDKRDMDKLFVRSFTTKAGGRGLGLAIVKEILDSCGGSISVTSTPERTEFVGLLPFAAAQNGGGADAG